jgi:hypothetical protein
LDPRIEKCGFPKWWNQWIFSGNHLHVEIWALRKKRLSIPPDRFRSSRSTFTSLFRGMNIQLPAMLMWTKGLQGFEVLTHRIWFPKMGVPPKHPCSWDFPL